MSAADPAILAKALNWLDDGRRVALATVIQTWGSAPQPVGSLLLIDEDGNFLGSVSGGCVEAEVIEQAKDVIATSAPKTLEFGVEDETAWKVGLACGGTIRIFIEKLDPGAAKPVLHQLIDDAGARRKVALVTDLSLRRSTPRPSTRRSGSRSHACAGRCLSPRQKRGGRHRDLHQRAQSDDAPDHRRRRACGATFGARWREPSATK